jgi:CHASE1-domain containing sensor protein/GAF domain-containing protein
MTFKTRLPPSGAVLAISLFLTLAGTVYVYLTAEERDRRRYEEERFKVRAAIQNRMETYIALLRATRGFMASVEHMTQEKFRTFISRSELQKRYPGIQGVGFSRRVSASDLGALVQARRQDGMPDFKLWPEEPARDEYHTIVYLEPLDERNKAAIGYDMFTNPVRREAMERARDTGQPAASGKVTLVQEISGRVQAGFLIYVPVYQMDPLPQSIEDRRRAIKGFAYSPFRADDLLNGIFEGSTNPDLAIRLYAGAELDSKNLLHQSVQQIPDKPHFASTVSLEIAGFPWTLEVFTLPAFDEGSTRFQTLYVALIGLVVSGILFGLSRSQERAAREREDLLERERKSREEAETLNRIGRILSGELDLQKLVQEVTDAATKLTEAEFGAFFYNVADASGNSYMLYTLSGADRKAFENFPMPRVTDVFAPTFQGKGPVMLEDVTKDPRYGKNPPHHGMPKGHLPVRSYLAVPVVSRSGEVIGGLFFGHSQPGRFKENNERLASGIAAQAAVAIDNARLFEETRRAIRFRDEFLSIASHELKTPLTSMRLQLDTLLRMAKKNGPSALNHETIVKMIESGSRQGQRLTRLVNELLDLSRITAGRLQLEREPVDLLGGGSGSGGAHETGDQTDPLALERPWQSARRRTMGPTPHRTGRDQSHIQRRSLRRRQADRRVCRSGRARAPAGH